MRTILTSIDKYKKQYLIVFLFLKIITLSLFSSEFSSGLFLPFVQIFINEGVNPWQYYFENNLNLDSFPYHGFMLYTFSIPVFIIHLFSIENEVLINFLFKTPLLLADIGIFAVLTTLYKRHYNKILLFYFLNPVIFYAIYVHSQLDIIPMVLLMASLLFLRKDKLWPFSIFLGLALAAKLHILMAAPLLFFYILKKESLKKSILYIGFSFVILLILDSLFLNSDGFLKMVMFNSKQSLLFDSYIKIGELTFLIPVAGITMVYLHFFNQKKVNYDLLSFYFIILFTAAIFSIYPAPAWYVWLIPFMTIYFIQYDNVKKSIFLYSLFSTIYLVFFIFFYESDYTDILFLGEKVDFKIENDKLRNIVFTLLEISLLSIMYAFYKYGVKSNSVYKMNTNLAIGVGGDSGVGKTTLVNSLKKLLGGKLLEIEGDGEHKWERGDENWNKFTHLDPKANHIHKQAEAIHELKLGHNIKRSEYDHKTGRFTQSSTVKPKEFIVISGLHPFYLPKLRKTIDLKIYIDTNEKLRRHWKIIRDTQKRGYSTEKILEQIEERISDTEKFIYPQKKYADLIINFYATNDFTLGLESEVIELGLRITLNANIHIEDILANLNCQYDWDYNDDLNSQFINLKKAPNVNFKNIALKSIKNINEVLTADNKWADGYEGLIQLISLQMICENLKE